LPNGPYRRCQNAARFSYYPSSDRRALLGTREGSRHAVFVDARVDSLGDRAHPRTQPRPAGTRRDRLPDTARSGSPRAPRLPGRLRADLGQPARDFVEWAIEQAPRVVRLEARDPSQSVVLDGRRSHHTTDSQGTRALDFETGERLPSKEASLRRGLLFADALDKLDIVNVMVAATDVPAHVRVVRHFEIAFELTSKPVRTGVLKAEQVPFLVELARAATGDPSGTPARGVCLTLLVIHPQDCPSGAPGVGRTCPTLVAITSKINGDRNDQPY